MWREKKSGFFEDLIIDSPNVKGISGIKVNTNFRLKHLGYINKELVDKKAELYRNIIPDKESTFKEMYLNGERKIKWNDNRNSLAVIFLNSLLSMIQLTHIVYKVRGRLSGMLRPQKS